jgi:hypothetical protein
MEKFSKGFENPCLFVLSTPFCSFFLDMEHIYSITELEQRNRCSENLLQSSAHHREDNPRIMATNS